MKTVLSVVTLAVGVGAVLLPVSGSSTHAVVVPPEMEPVAFAVPDWARIANASVSVTPCWQETSISLYMRGPMPANRSGRWAVELFFDSATSASPYSLGIVYLPPGGEEVSAIFPAGSAWLIDLENQTLLSQLTVSLDATVITFSLPAGLLGNSQLLWCASRFLPCGPDDLPISVSLVSLFQQQRTAPRSKPGRFPFPYELPNDWIPIPLPDTSPVGDPSRWRDVEDVDGDGRTVFDLEPDVSLGGDWLLGVWDLYKWWRWDESAVHIGRDTNGNGRLDKDEISVQVGSCPVPGGMDSGSIYKRPNGSYVIVWEVQQPQHNGAWIIRYVYDSSKPIQSRLRIYVKRGDDQPWELVWVGNPLQYPWNDKGQRVGHDFPPPLLGPTLPGGPAP
jgi:hypothetical protein